jgi:hypothetical protein
VTLSNRPEFARVSRPARKGEALLLGLSLACALEPDGERLVAYLERRTPWDS